MMQSTKPRRSAKERHAIASAQVNWPKLQDGDKPTPREQEVLEHAVRESFRPHREVTFYKFEKFGAGWLCLCNRTFTTWEQRKVSEDRCMFLVMKHANEAYVSWSLIC